MSDLINNVPALRFSGYTLPWVKNKLGSFGVLVSGLTYSPDNIVEDGLLVLRSSNVQNSQIALTDNVYVDIDVAENNLTRKDDILICIRNGSKRLIGKNTLIPESLPKATHGAFMAVFRGANNKFIYQWMQTEKYFKQVHKNLGATINSINGSDLKKFPIIASDNLEEQQKIADFLSSVDKKIEQLTEKHRLLTEYKKGVMQQIFTQQIRFKDDSGNDYPEWEEKKLGQFGSIVGGGTPETSKSSYWEGDIQWFTPTEIKQKYMSKSIRTISEEGLKKSSAKLLPVGALLLTTRATIADLSIATQECSTNQGFQSIIVNDQNDNEFLYYWILNNRKQFIRKASGSTFPEISKKEIEKMEGVFPQKEEQQKIANFLTEIDQKIDQAWSTLEQTKAFKKGLLQKMFV